MPHTLTRPNLTTPRRPDSGRLANVTLHSLARWPHFRPSRPLATRARSTPILAIFISRNQTTSAIRLSPNSITPPFPKFLRPRKFRGSRYSGTWALPSSTSLGYVSMSGCFFVCTVYLASARNVTANNCVTTAHY